MSSKKIVEILTKKLEILAMQLVNPAISARISSGKSSPILMIDNKDDQLLKQDSLLLGKLINYVRQRFRINFCKNSKMILMETLWSNFFFGLSHLARLVQIPDTHGSMLLSF